MSELRKTEIVSFYRSKYRLDSEIERVDMWFIVVSVFGCARISLCSDLFFISVSSVWNDYDFSLNIVSCKRFVRSIALTRGWEERGAGHYKRVFRRSREARLRSSLV